MAVSLTPPEADADYGLTVSTVDIADAFAQIHGYASYTVDELVAAGCTDEGRARRAVAVVASRLRETTTGDASRHLTSEQAEGYGYTVASPTGAANESVMAGTPVQLLGLDRGVFLPRYTGRTPLPSHRVFPVLVDDFGVPVE